MKIYKSILAIRRFIASKMIQLRPVWPKSTKADALIDYALIGALMAVSIGFMYAGSSLNITCIDGTVSGGNCYPGHVHFTGSNFPVLVHVRVVRADSITYDDFDYNAPGGALDFTETLYPAASYAVTITDATGNAGTLATANLTTGD